jgi:transcriptional regulator with XRE-family HTH domain
VRKDRDFDRSWLALFVEELKIARSRAGLSQDQLADQIGYSASLVAKIETRRGVPTLDFAARCDEALGTSEALARMHKFLGKGPFPSWFRPFVDYEAAARSLRLFEHVLVPGLLQTREYARAVLSTRPNTTDEETEQLVSAGWTGKPSWKPMTRRCCGWCWMGVLHRQVADPKVMHGQLTQLADLSGRSNITVEIVPYGAGAHSGLLGALVIAEFEDAPAIVYLETAAGGQIAEGADVVAQVTLTFDTLRSESLTHRLSRDMIMKVAEETWT